MADWNGLWLKRTRSDLINSVSGEIDGERKTARAQIVHSVKIAASTIANAQ